MNVMSCQFATFTFLIFCTMFLVTVKVPAHSYLDTEEDNMSNDNFAFLLFFNEEVLPLAEEWMGGEDDQRHNALGNRGNQDVSTDGDIPPRRPIVEDGNSCCCCFPWCFSKEPEMIADVEYDGDVEDDEETPLVVRRRTRRRRRRVRMARVGCSIQ